jgi:hypothetical protein
VPARADLEVERAVHAVLLRAEDRREVLSHGGAWIRPTVRPLAEKQERDLQFHHMNTRLYRQNNIQD